MQNKPLKRGKLSHRTMLAVLLTLLVVPSTILLGMFCLGDRKYYFISLLIVCYAMLPFVMIFEKRKPQARELIVISVMTALAVASRAAFFMLPQIKPVAAIVIITAVCFGAESGSLVGAVSGFVSNFFFGQGPWTPWQMFCFGAVGLCAGILAQKGILKKTKLPLCIFGGLATFFIYGGIVDLGSLLMFTSSFSWKALLATYASGFWFNVIHAASTVVFLFFLSGPMIEKLERMKIKYGMLDTGINLQN